jgi:hypothetical protein
MTPWAHRIVRRLACLSLLAAACGEAKREAPSASQAARSADRVHANGALPASPEPPITCDGIWSPDSGEATLRRHFGDSLVQTGPVDVGEGMTEPGTVVETGMPADRLEILWKDTVRHTGYARITLRKPSTRTTYAGIHIGSSLDDVARINGRPFQLTGFGWDYSGTVVSWAGGTLDQVTGGRCRVLLRFEPQPNQTDSAAYRQALGEQRYASSDSAMRALDPRVYEIVLIYAE